jgi:ABC-type transport system involved in multi-copper enzyme maturation permease subunit
MAALVSLALSRIGAIVASLTASVISSLAAIVFANNDPNEPDNVSSFILCNLASLLAGIGITLMVTI